MSILLLFPGKQQSEVYFRCMTLFMLNLPTRCTTPTCSRARARKGSATPSPILGLPQLVNLATRNPAMRMILEIYVGSTNNWAKQFAIGTMGTRRRWISCCRTGASRRFALKHDTDQYLLTVDFTVCQNTKVDSGSQTEWRRATRIGGFEPD